MKLILTQNGNGGGVFELENPKINYSKAVNKTAVGQVSSTLLSGDSFVNHVGGYKVEVELSLRFLTPQDKDRLEAFITDCLRFSLNSFSIEIIGLPQFHCIDLGKGHDVSKIENVRLNTQSLSGMFEVRAPGIYHVVLPFTYRQGIVWG